MSEHGPAPDAPSIYDSETPDGKGATKVALVAALGGFLFGYDSAVINGAVSAVESHFDISKATLGFAVASALLGAAAGAVFAGRLADKVGRVRVMKIAAVLFLVSAVFTGLATSVTMLVIFRIVGGVGVGAASVIAPAYIAEIAPAHVRGRLGSLQQLAIVSGIFASLSIDFLLAKAAGGSRGELWFGMEAWRWMFLAMMLPAVVYGVLAATIPESPRYLVATGQIDEARQVLRRLLRIENVDAKITQIRSSLVREHRPSIKDLRGPALGLLPIVWVGILLSVFQQFVGINVIFYYSNTLWESVGFNENDSFTITVITSVVNILVTLIAIATVDKFGRKPLLVIGSTGMTITLGVMAFIFGTAKVVNDAPQLGDTAGIVALIAANLFVVSFGMSWGPVVWVLLGEAFPNRIRAAALAIAAAAQWVANWAITVSFPKMSSISLGMSYGVYALFAALSLVFVLKFVRETKGMELEDMPG